ncbi:MAG: hypothetical protein BWZ03_00091 [bacterium ADurb.BinA186]|nr:MAG: hypothetical protein BWZ03_00091 [bacterium ADurb.BinA186]
MALGARSSFLYGYTITPENSSLDFKANVSDTVAREATLRLGYYSLASLVVEIKRAIQALDSVNTYTVTADRTVAGGTQNRITITSSGSFFQLLFATGPRATSSCAALIGFPFIDLTGSVTYTSYFTTGTQLVTRMPGYGYVSEEQNQRVFGTVNVSASGLKEAIVFAFQKFITVEFKYESKDAVNDEWVPFMKWAIQQRRFEFVPEVSSPSIFIDVTLERTSEDGKGLAFRFQEMLPQLPNFYKTGTLTMRQNTA